MLQAVTEGLRRYEAESGRPGLTVVSQKDASFPSYEPDGPFSDLAQRIQVEQYQKVKRCLGREWFYEHPSALIRATRGLVFLKEMCLGELYARSRALRQATENR